jgi:hypothetical protein
MLLNTYYNFWNQGCTIQMNFKHNSHSHEIMAKSAKFSLITTLSPCNSIYSNQFLLTPCTISKSTSRWTTLMKITLPNSSLITSYAHPKLQHYNKCNNLHLAILAKFLNSNFSTTTSIHLWSFTTNINTHFSKTFTIWIISNLDIFGICNFGHYLQLLQIVILHI